MSTSPMRSTDILIVGAGPTGLVLALWLTRLGVRVRIVHKTAEPGTTSRALAGPARTLKIGFPGGKYDHVFYVADVAAKGSTMNGEVHVGLDTTDFLAVFPLKSVGHARLVGTVLETQPRDENLSWNDVSKRVIDWMSIAVERVNSFSPYNVHHRVADHFRKGRAFLL